jgi:predicted nucleic acid-binding protein
VVPGVVLDSSVALTWFFQDESNDYADAVQDSLALAPAVVPTIWPLEIANALLVGERRKRSTPAQGLTWTTFLLSLPITVDTETTTQAFAEILGLGRAHRLSAYDAAYIELAAHRRLQLATLDRRLRRAAEAAGVVTFAVA